MEISFLPVQKSNLNQVVSIYNYYVKHSTATFHLHEVDEIEMEQMLYVNHLIYKSYLILSDGETIGFCYISPFRKKEAYDISAEVTLYLKSDFTGKNTGKTVLDFMEKCAKEQGIKNLIAVITAENKESIKLFEKCGYLKCGHLKNIGVKFGRTLDVLTYQKEL
ncbi:MAG: N-acetyltransferase [Flavobacteriales bacterium]|nr:N-acetyltransferase [Flavobacteriales bacterium]